MIQNTVRQEVSATQMKAVGSQGRQIVPLIFSDGKLLDLNAKELKFLESWMRLNDFSKACEEQGLAPDKAKRILSRPKNRVYIDDRMKEIAISKGLTADWFMTQLYAVWEGKKVVNREQMEAIKEIGRRNAPSKRDESSEKVVININIDAVKEAVARQSLINQENVEKGQTV